MPNSLYNALLDTANQLEGRLDEALKSVGLSRAKMDALEQLMEAGGSLSLHELAERTGCVASNVTTLVKRLESDRLVTRVTDPGDRRSVRAALTPLGKERVVAGAAEVKRLNDEFLASLRIGERAALAHTLACLARNQRPDGAEMHI